MSVTRRYDEMADRYTYHGSLHPILHDKNGAGIIKGSAAYVDLNQGGDTFWIQLSRKGNDWHWINNRNFIVLADGQRMNGVGYLRDSEVTQEQGFFETKIVCNEEVHCSGNFDVMKLLANSTNVKMRLGDIDMVMPEEIIADIREIVHSIESHGGYGA